MILWKCCTQYASKFGKCSSGHRIGKGQFSFQIPKKGNAKECSNYHTIALISHTSKAMLKILQARLQQYMNWELPDVQTGFTKGRGTRESCQHLLDHRKAREFQKNIIFCFIDYTEGFDYVDHNKLWKILQEMEIPQHLTCLLRNLHAGQEATVRTRHGKTVWFQIGKEFFKTVYCHPTYLTSMQSTSCKMDDEWSTSWTQDCQEDYQLPQICRWHHPYGRNQRRTIESPVESERGEWKSWLKVHNSKNENHGIQPHDFMANR